MAASHPYREKTKEELQSLKTELSEQYRAFQEKGLKLDMSRGKPSPAQLDLSMGLMDVLKSTDTLKASDGADCRNYGVLDGIPEAKSLFGEMLGVKPSEIIIGGNSSLNMMYDTVARALLHGVLGSERAWSKYDTVKFLCPSPGYDRHFAICEHFGIEMITIDMQEDGPDMDKIEALVSADPSIKGIWCVPMYSNPDGTVYSDTTVRRFARLRPAAKDFRIFWDNAYCVHHLCDEHPTLLNILDECKATGNVDMVYIFASTAKVSFAGAGIAMMAASEANIAAIKKQLTIQTIGSDKLNQLRHVKYFRDMNGINAHMLLHRASIAPKFEAVLHTLEEELSTLELASWTKPKGGYFISLDTMDGCAKRVVTLCKEAGVVLTPAGATYPYGKDPRDRNIRIAPTYPPVAELLLAAQLLCLCIKLVSVERLLSE